MACWCSAAFDSKRGLGLPLLEQIACRGERDCGLLKMGRKPQQRCLVVVCFAGRNLVRSLMSETSYLIVVVKVAGHERCSAVAA